MKAALYILLCAAPFGAFDVIYFHLWKFRLYSRPASRAENVTHLIRGLVFPTALLVLLAGDPRGRWYSLLVCLFVGEVINSLVDVAVEPSSRAPGAVPPLEAVLHAVGVAAVGAAGAALLIGNFSRWSEPTALLPHPPGFLPSWLAAGARLALIVAISLSVFETTLWARATHLSRRPLLRAPTSG